MPRLSATLFAVVLLLVFATNSFAAPVRTLNGIAIDSSDRQVKVHLELENNNGRSLGKVYYSGSMIRIVVENTVLGQKTIRSLKSKDSALSSVSIEKQGKDLSLKLKLTKKITSIMEHIVFEPGLNGSTIAIRKPSYFTAEVIDESSSAKDLEPVIQEPVKIPEPVKQLEKPPFPDELLEQPKAQPKKIAGIKEDLSIGATKDSVAQKENKPDVAKGTKKTDVPGADAVDKETIEQRKKRMTELFGEEPEKKVEQPEGSFWGIGGNTPDMTNLYIMAAVVLLLALLWLLFARNRNFSLSGLAGPLQVIRTQSLGGKHKIILVQAEGKRLLLASTDKDVRLLTELDAGRSSDEQMREAVSNTNVRYLFSGEESETSGPPDIMPRPASKNTKERPSYFGGGSKSGPAFQRSHSTAYRGADYSQNGPQGDMPGKKTPPPVTPGKEASKEPSLKDKLRNLRRGG